MKCECGFELETRPGHFRNFNVKLVGSPLVKGQNWIMICPKCGAEYEKVN
jgi:hypothetical protein